MFYVINESCYLLSNKQLLVRQVQKLISPINITWLLPSLLQDQWVLTKVKIRTWYCRSHDPGFWVAVLQCTPASCKCHLWRFSKPSRSVFLSLLLQAGHHRQLQGAHLFIWCYWLKCSLRLHSLRGSHHGIADLSRSWMNFEAGKVRPPNPQYLGRHSNRKRKLPILQAKFGPITSASKSTLSWQQIHW